MAIRTGLENLLVAGLFILSTSGCGHRSTSNSVSGAPKATANQPVMLMVGSRDSKTFQSVPPAIQFDYPVCWAPCKNNTADFTIEGPQTLTKCTPTICLDIPKLPWHIPGMIPIAMVARGYVDDLRTKLMPDAVVKEQFSLTVAGATARRVTCVGHIKGDAWVDVAVIMIHADHVYILSSDSDDAGKAAARQTLDDAIASLKWLK